jgi:hypothetical protein
VSDSSEHGPSSVRVEVTRRAVLESRAFLEIADGQFHDGVTTVVGIEEDGLTVAVGDEGVVAVGGKERGPGVVQFRAANDETVTGVEGLANPGLAVQRVVDSGPLLLDAGRTRTLLGVWVVMAG